MPAGVPESTSTRDMILKCSTVCQLIIWGTGVRLEDRVEVLSGFLKNLDVYNAVPGPRTILNQSWNLSYIPTSPRMLSVYPNIQSHP